jgi:hypothetical protein
MSDEEALKSKAPLLAAALSLLGASLGITVAGDAVADSKAHAPTASSAQIKGERGQVATSAQLKGSQAKSSQTKGAPVKTAYDLKSSQAKSSQTKGAPVKTTYDLKSSQTKSSQTKGRPVQSWDLPTNKNQ